MTKKILLSGIVGTIVYYLLGWLVYGFILPEKSTGEESMLFIFLGCLFYAFLIAYVFCKLAQLTSFKTGFTAGLVMGILYAMVWYFFMNWEFKPMAIIEEIIIGGLMTAVLGGAVAYVNGKVG
ncbi:MAG: hypothetical protein P8M02_05870 [Flavobacteriaceae bacterium]|jgi:hypothetical protein|nr:hypothetical protein [Flavobacteriaceae bacterium]MDG2386924.1 hypothetical protein [Flavobacteriaceae bacterium]